MVKARPNNVKDILYELSNQVEDIMHHNDTCLEEFEEFEEPNASNDSDSQHSNGSDSVTDSDTDETEEAVNNHVKNESFFYYKASSRPTIDPSDFSERQFPSPK